MNTINPRVFPDGPEIAQQVQFPFQQCRPICNLQLGAILLKRSLCMHAGVCPPSLGTELGSYKRAARPMKAVLVETSTKQDFENYRSQASEDEVHFPSGRSGGSGHFPAQSSLSGPCQCSLPETQHHLPTPFALCRDGGQCSSASPGDPHLPAHSAAAQNTCCEY